MSFDEYQQLTGEKNKALNELSHYKQALETVYGREQAISLLDQARKIDDRNHRQKLRILFERGQL